MKTHREWASSILNPDAVTLEDDIFYESNAQSLECGAFDPKLHENLFSIEDNSWWFRYRNKIIESGISRFLTQKCVIVDVGGGNGFVASHLSKIGFDVVLFEPGLQGCKNARRRGLKKIVCAPFSSKIVKRGSVSAVGLFDVMEHMENEANSLGDVYELLVADGMLFGTVPAHKWLWSQEDENAGHFRRYSASSLSEVLRSNGFKVVYVSYFFRFLSLPISIFRVLPFKIFGKKGARHTEPSLGKSAFVVPKFVESIISLLFGKEAEKIRTTSIKHGSSIFFAAKKEAGESISENFK